MPTALRTALVLLVATAVGAPGLAAQEPGGRCQKEVGRAGKAVVRGTLGALAGCAKEVARGRRPAGTDCLADPVLLERRADGSAAAVRRIPTACAAVESVHGGACAEARSGAALGACIAGGHDANAAEVLAAVAAPGALDATARRCEGALLRRLRTFTLRRLSVLQRCKRRPPSDLLPGTKCREEPKTAARLANLRSKAAATMAARCDVTAIAALQVGPPCAAATDGMTLAACLLDGAETAVDDAVAAEFPDGSFCGDAAAAVDARIDELLATMTLDEKLEQMHGTGFSFSSIARTAANERLGLPGIVMVDGPRGVGKIAGNATAFPVGAARGATWDPGLEERVGAAMAREARAKGASMLLAPTINLLRHPRWGRAQETYGEDPALLGAMAVGFVSGVQGAGVIANPKHFAANSIENTRVSVDVSIDERTLREVYLPQYRAAVRRGHAASIMSAYNEVNGQYCGENVHLLGEVLKGDWGFLGFVESDWFLGTRSTIPAVTAGLDVEMPAADHYGQPLRDAVEAGDVPEATIDAAVRRVLRAQLCFRLDSDPPVVDPGQVETPATIALARDVARESLVLLKNAGGALPLVRTAGQTIVVVGALATRANIGDLGSSAVIPSHVVTALDGITAGAGAGVAVTHVEGVLPLSPADEATIAGAAAVVVVAGLTSDDEGEGQITHGDRDGLALPGEQDQLIAAVAALQAHTVVVLEGSGALLMPWLDDVPAVLHAWYPGEEGGTAIAEVLFGDVNPSGKLPVSFPRAEADLPPFDDTATAVTYGYLHGYRHLDAMGTAPLFPFGFGLSYTTFAYDDLVVTPPATASGRVRVTADVANAGAVAGDEVAQLYVSAVGSAVERPVKELKAFQRVHLEPGAHARVAFELPVADLAYWSVADAGWVVEPITYTVQVGGSSGDLPLSGAFTVAP